MSGMGLGLLGSGLLLRLGPVPWRRPGLGLTLGLGLKLGLGLESRLGLGLGLELGPGFIAAMRGDYLNPVLSKGLGTELSVDWNLGRDTPGRECHLHKYETAKVRMLQPGVYSTPHTR